MQDIFKKNYWILLISIIAALNTACQKSNKKNKLPNILIVVADDLGWNDVGFHGSEIRTPFIDQLATEGIQLNRFYTAPICTPTRAGIMLGKYPNRFGLRYGVCSPRSLEGIPTEETTLAEFLSVHGFKNRAAFGKWHLGHSNTKYHPLSQGFTYFYGHYNGAIDYFTHKRDAEIDWHRNFDPLFEEGYSTDLIGKDVMNYISNKKNEGPFFAYVAFNAPHSPMQAKEDELLEYGYKSDLTSKKFPVGGQQSGEREKDSYGKQGRGNNVRQTYAGMVSSMDKQIGNIITHLKKNNLYDNTIIWFLSDNGGTPKYGGDNTPLKGIKNTEWEGGVRTVSIVKPNFKHQINKIDQVISYIDIYPTLAALIGENTTNMKFDGTNISAAFKGSHIPDRTIFLGKNALVSDKWKLVEKQLFQIDIDISESTNVAEKFQDQFKKMHQQLDVFKAIEKGEHTYQTKKWLPPKNWKMPDAKKE